VLKRFNEDEHETIDDESKTADSRSGSEASSDDDESSSEDDWIPGQDVHVDHPKILDILVTFLKDASGMLG
jgi:vacuole morphology and inheritance protein 14